MTHFDYHSTAPSGPALAAIVLQSDERIELDFRRLIPEDTRLFISRVPSAPAVTSHTLAQMAVHIPAAAARLPGNLHYGAIGYGCTSATAEIGADQVHDLIRQSAKADVVSDPLSALVAACETLGQSKLAFLSPYVEPVSLRLRSALLAKGIETPIFGSFNESSESAVARIAPKSIAKAARDLAAQGGVDAVFLSCTNLDTLDIIASLRHELAMPILSSNLVLAWHMCRVSGISSKMDIR